MHRQLHDDQVVLSHHSMDNRGRTFEIVLQRRDGLPHAFASLRACRVLDEILGEEVESRSVTTSRCFVEGQDGFGGRHVAITHEARYCAQMRGTAPTPGCSWGF